MGNVFRVYEPHECGADDYPVAWHGLGDADGVKHLVRADAGYRCERCKHPYQAGAGTWGEERGNPEPPSGLLSLLEEADDDPDLVKRQIRFRPPLWSRCDALCDHKGKLRVVTPDGPLGSEHEDLTAREVIEAFRDDCHVEAAWRILTVHHLNGRKHDLRWWNLAALCQRCHLEIQGKVVMERVYPLEHSEWFKIHAAGWYAYAYEGRDITREEATARLGELLALECLV